MQNARVRRRGGEGVAKPGSSLALNILRAGLQLQHIPAFSLRMLAAAAPQAVRTGLNAQQQGDTGRVTVILLTDGRANVSLAKSNEDPEALKPDAPKPTKVGRPVEPPPPPSLQYQMPCLPHLLEQVNRLCLRNLGLPCHLEPQAVQQTAMTAVCEPSMKREYVPSSSAGLSCRSSHPGVHPNRHFPCPGLLIGLRHSC